MLTAAGGAYVNFGPATGVQLPTGRLVVTVQVGTTPTNMMDGVMLSDDFAKTWRFGSSMSAVAPPAGTLSENQVAITRNGSLLMNTRNTPGDPCHCRLTTRSTVSCIVLRTVRIP